MAKHDGAGPGSWLDPGGPDSVGEQELEAAQALFLVAAKRARSAHATGMLRPAPELSATRRLAWRRVYAAAAAVLLLGLAIGLAVLLPVGKPVVAAPFMGLRGTVTSLYDGRPVPGVEIWRIDQPQRSALGTRGGCSARRAQAAKNVQHATGDKFVGLTNALGWYEISPDPGATSSEYVLRLGAEELERFYTAAEDEITQGYRDFYVAVQPADVSSEYRLELKPGADAQPTPQYRVALDQAAAGGWQGKLVNSRRWPSNFIYGQVAGGIYTLEGPATKDVMLGVYINRKKLEYFDGKPEDLKLIAYSSAYIQAEEQAQEEAERFNKAHPEAQPKFTGWRIEIHKGWYTASAPPYAVLPRVELHVTADTQRDAQGPLGYWATWRAAPGTPYVLLIPPNIKGEAVLCWRNRYAWNGEKFESFVSPTVQFLNRNRQQQVLCDVDYTDSTTNMTYTVNYYPLRPHNDFCIWDEFEPRGYFHNTDKFMLDLGLRLKAGTLDGSFTLRLMDFTVDQQLVCEKIVCQPQPAPGIYNITVGAIKLGQPVELRLTGDLDRLAAPPDWDLYGDQVLDKFGMFETSFTPLHIASYAVQTRLREKNGNTVVTECEVSVPTPGIMGYEYDAPAYVPVVEGLIEPRPETSKLFVVTPCAVASSAAYGYIASMKAGPSTYIELPAGFYDVPLKEMRLHLYAQAAGGDAADQRDGGTQYLQDTQHMFLLPLCSWGTLEQGPFLSLRGEDDFLPVVDGFQQVVENSDGGHSYYYSEALQRQADPDPDAVYKFLRRQFNTSLGVAYVKQYTGIDLEHPQDQARIVQALEQFLASSDNSMRFATPQRQELQWTWSLWGMNVPRGAGVMARIHLNDYNTLNAGQWYFYSGGECPSRVEIETMSGDVLTRYFDYSPLATASR